MYKEQANLYAISKKKDNDTRRRDCSGARAVAVRLVWLTAAMSIRKACATDERLNTVLLSVEVDMHGLAVGWTMFGAFLNLAFGEEWQEPTKILSWGHGSVEALAKKCCELARAGRRRVEFGETLKGPASLRQAGFC